MKWLAIRNEGEIDINALFLLGASTKRGDSEKIGFFGSGNKYAVATLLRKGVPFRVFSGTREITFHTEDVTYRGETFGVIFIDGQKSSFTTSMGPTWETWFALREFICNAKDEGGYALFDCEEANVEGTPDATYIFVQMTEEVAAFHASLNTYIRVQEETETVDTYNSKVKLIPKEPGEKLTVYRKGIRCNPETSVKSIMDYDFDNVDINESRVYNSEFTIQIGIAGALMACTDEKLIRLYLDKRKDHDYVESRIDDQFMYNPASRISKAWADVIGDALVVGEARARFLPADDLIGAFILRNALVDKLAERFPDMKISGRADERYTAAEFNAKDAARIKEALAFLARLGYHENGLTFHAVKFWDDENVAMYIPKESRVLLAIDKLGSEDYLIATLFEELGHHNTGLEDGTRAFEQWVMDQVIFQGRRALKEWPVSI